MHTNWRQNLDFSNKYYNTKARRQEMKVSLVSVAIGQCMLRMVSSLSTTEEGLFNRALATCPAGGIIDTTGKYCCSGSCGQCGGSGCDNRPGGPSACCTSQITKSCTSSGLPCIASEGASNKCPAGGILDPSGKTCCSAACGQCGGNGCHLRTGGAAACCTSQVSTSCSAGKLPCLLSETMTPTPTPTNPPGTLCPAGSIVDGTQKVCCPSSCETCGGNGCHLRPGGAAACCTSQVTKSCAGNQPPCLLVGTQTQPPTSSCPVGGILDASGKICCTGSCGTCGGSGCDKRTGGSANCCTSQITASCAGGKLPCVLEGATSTPPPSGLCANGILATIADFDACDVEVCCPKSCPVCDTTSNCTAKPECCAQKFAASVATTDVDVSCRNHEPPCVMPPVDDPCTTNNPCKNGARCGFAFQGDIAYHTCSPRTTCECDEIGNYSGIYCELKCGTDETPCGYSYSNYTTNMDRQNNICCTAAQDCAKVNGKYGYSMRCFPNDRPMSCSPDPCQNGGTCYNYNYYNSQAPVYLCECPTGFQGTLCEKAA